MRPAAQGSGKVARKLAAPHAPLGYALCLINLTFDGYTNAAQDEIHRKYSATTALHTMCWMNFWCGLFYVPFLFGLTNTGRELLAFCIQYPEVGWRKSCRQWHPISLMPASFTVVPALVAREGCRCTPCL